MKVKFYPRISVSKDTNDWVFGLTPSVIIFRNDVFQMKPATV